MNPTSRTMKTVFSLAVVFLTAGTALAIERPPQDAQQQRAWLVGHLVTDMEALGTFDGNTLAKVPGIVNALTDEQVALLAQYYFLTRSKTEQDASLYAMQQQGYADQQVNEAKAEIADLLTTMNDQIEACYAQFTPMAEPVQYLAQICYASVPGWCCHARCYVPEWYYDNGCFVGPCFNAVYSGPWAVPICNAYFNHGSHFYSVYNNVARTTHINRSVNLAKRNANWLRNHGDWHNTLAHDRLLHQSTTAHLGTTAKNRIGKQALAVHNPHAAAAHTGSNHARVGNQKAAVHNQPHKAGNRNRVARSPKTHQQAHKAYGNHSSAARQHKAHQQAAKPRVSHASAPRPRTSHPAHASQPRPAAHAQAHARPAAHAPAHSGSGGHSKHR